MNDIDERLQELFMNSIHGKCTTRNQTEWISRQTFKDRFHDDGYIAICWSFGNNAKDYLYSVNIEPFKKAYHRLVFFNDPTEIKEYGFDISLINTQNIYQRYLPEISVL